MSIVDKNIEIKFANFMLGFKMIINLFWYNIIGAMDIEEGGRKDAEKTLPWVEKYRP